MKTLMVPIELIAWFTKDGILNPLRFKYPAIGFGTMIKIDKIVNQRQEKLAGSRTIVFHCQSLSMGSLKLFELKYEVNTCKWFLYKI